MERKITIAGIQLDNCPVRESMRMLDKASADRAFFSVTEVTTDLLLRAGTDEKVQRAIQRCSHTILADTAIPKAAGQGTPQRTREILDRSFFRELMRHLEQEAAAICLLCDTGAHAASAKEILLQQFPHINITDVEILDECTGTLDHLINNINARTQDVVLSLLPSPVQEHFFADYRDKISASLWYGAGPVNPVRCRGLLTAFLRERKRVHALEKLMA